MSRNSSPATASSQSIRTPPTQSQPPFGYINHRSYGSTSNNSTHSPSTIATSSPQTLSVPYQGNQLSETQGYFGNMPIYNDYNPGSQYNPLPTNFPDLGPWNPSFNFTTSGGQHHPSLDLPAVAPLDNSAAMGNFSANNNNNNGFSSMHPMPPTANGNPPPVTYADYLYPQATATWTREEPDMGLNREQQMELMDCLQTDSGHIKWMIQESDALFHPNSTTAANGKG
ncbi:hypothetical protein LTS18_010676 [Coniosporium uncinatum]|uniref:Uncharacterized protein n=1 Tax=Coniosporium uncinatum TaxID=93489 RepID=A0ACC3DYX8_9PEZI|nr:hypothetical protein LTS18_010676 [Coniosporium uncinatum]